MRDTKFHHLTHLCMITCFRTRETKQRHLKTTTLQMTHHGPLGNYKCRPSISCSHVTHYHIYVTEDWDEITPTPMVTEPPTRRREAGKWQLYPWCCLFSKSEASHLVSIWGMAVSRDHIGLYCGRQDCRTLAEWLDLQFPNWNTGVQIPLPHLPSSGTLGNSLAFLCLFSHL